MTSSAVAAVPPAVLTCPGYSREEGAVTSAIGAVAVPLGALTVGRPSPAAAALVAHTGWLTAGRRLGALTSRAIAGRLGVLMSRAVAGRLGVLMSRAIAGRLGVLTSRAIAGRLARGRGGVQ